jgi:phytanoyl-CoA hydroxylase
MTTSAIDLKHFYLDHGYLHLKQALSRNDLEPIKTCVSKAVDQHADGLFDQGKITNKYVDESFERRLAAIHEDNDIGLRGWYPFTQEKELYDLIVHPITTKNLEHILGPAFCWMGGYHLRPKLPESSLMSFPWHQDSQYYGAPTQYIHLVTVWIPLVDVNEENGCLWVIPASHKWGLLHGERGEDLNMRTKEDVEKKGEPIPLPMKVGDVLFLSNLTFHSSRPNRSNKVRWSIDMRYCPTPEKQLLSPQEKHGYEFYFDKVTKDGKQGIPLTDGKADLSYEEWSQQVVVENA